MERPIAGGKVGRHRAVVKVVITGGCGFIGQRLAARILELGSLARPDGTQAPVEEVVLFDAGSPPRLPQGIDGKVRIVTGDIADQTAVKALIDRDDISIFHLASVVSGGGEKDFDLAMRVNLTGGLNLFEAARARGGAAKLVFASSIAVFGGEDMSATVGDLTKQAPQTTYGTTKAICELLVNDYTRKGFFDGRSARLPTVIIRPGKANAAASSFASAVFREPLKGEDYTLPVDVKTPIPVIGYRAVVDGLVALHELPGQELGADRAVSLPALTVSVEGMIASLRRVAAGRRLGEITVEPDPFIEGIVATWPKGTDDKRGLRLGLPADRNLDEIIAYYIEDYVDGPDAALFQPS
ncbi:MAG: D-erythronate dehydrogenase [Parvibaculaceae bacterium]